MFIYKIENLVNEKIYVGQTIRPINLRYKGHLRSAKNKICHPLYNSMNRHGINNFIIKEIEDCRSIEELNLREIFWINYFKSQEREFGYNLDGGGKNGKHTEETKRKIGLKSKGRVASAETREKRRLAGTRRRHTEESKKRMSEIQKGHIVTEETRKKISVAKKGIKMSEEMKKRMSIINIGRKHTEKAKRNMSIGQKGHFVSEKTKQKLREINIGKIVSTETRLKLSIAGKKRRMSKESIAKTIRTRKERDNYKHSKETKIKLRGQKRSKEVRMKMSIARKKYLLKMQQNKNL